MSTSPPFPSLDPRAGNCSSCGAVLAADQRYCLACGARRDQARLPFRDALAPTPATVLPAPPMAYYAPSPGPAAQPVLLTTLAALACVLLAFGVGILVGNHGGSKASQQPIVLGAGAAAPVATTAAAAAPTATTPKSDASSSSSADDSSSDTASKKQDPVTKASPKKVAAESKKALSDLGAAKSTEDYARKSAKLPDVVVTGGGAGQ